MYMQAPLWLLFLELFRLWSSSTTYVFVLVYYTANQITKQGFCFKTRVGENITNFHDEYYKKWRTPLNMKFVIFFLIYWSLNASDNFYVLLSCNVFHLPLQVVKIIVLVIRSRSKFTGSWNQFQPPTGLAVSSAFHLAVTNVRTINFVDCLGSLFTDSYTANNPLSCRLYFIWAGDNLCE